jgi:hypothetical protein
MYVCVCVCVCVYVHIYIYIYIVGGVAALVSWMKSWNELRR